MPYAVGFTCLHTFYLTHNRCNIKLSHIYTWSILLWFSVRSFEFICDGPYHWPLINTLFAYIYLFSDNWSGNIFCSRIFPKSFFLLFRANCKKLAFPRFACAFPLKIMGIAISYDGNSKRPLTTGHCGHLAPAKANRSVFLTNLWQK